MIAWFAIFIAITNKYKKKEPICFPAHFMDILLSTLYQNHKRTTETNECQENGKKERNVRLSQTLNIKPLHTAIDKRTR